MDWFRIDWKGGYPISTAQERSEADGFGIYAIYERKGETPQLLYVGETYWQSFGRRLQQHKREWLDDRIRGPVVIHFGEVGIAEGKRNSHEKVLDVESFLIHALRPPYNTMSKRGYQGRDIMIFNFGKVGTLPPIVCEEELHDLITKAMKSNALREDSPEPAKRKAR